MSSPSLQLMARHSWAGLPLLGLLSIALPLVALSGSGQRQFIVIAIYTLIVVGLNLSFGYAGELAFGQAAMFAAGAYAAGILAANGYRDLLVALLVGMAAAAVVALISGIPGLRLNLWALAVTSFFLVILLPRIVSIGEEHTGGLAGLSGITGPRLAGVALTFEQYFAVAVTVACLWLIGIRNLVRSRIGTSMRVLRESPVLAESLGASAYRIRVRAYVLGGLPAGAAGVIYAYLNGYISPDAFTLQLSIAILAASVVGGSDSIWGAPIGAAILVLGPLQSAAFERYSLVVYGAFLVLAGVAFGSGLAGIGRAALRRLTARVFRSDATTFVVAPAGSQEGSDDDGLTIDGQRLVVEDVRKAFGGNRALDGAELVAEPGRITAILGANGAGKTTLLNTISGFIAPDQGRIVLGGESLTGRRAHDVARLGVGRTFQTPLVPRSVSVLEVVEAGRLSHGSVGVVASMFRLPRFWRARREDHRRSVQALRFAGLEELASKDAEALPLGTRRLLEVVRAVAREPKLMLLDEPAAGLDDDGLAELGTLVRRSRDVGATVVIVEHNVPFVLDLADDVYVMHLGKVIASGSPEEIRRHPAVIESYLGRGAATTTPETEEVR